LEETIRSGSSTVVREKAVLAAVIERMPVDAHGRKADPLEELRQLAEAAGAVVVGEMVQTRARPVAGTYIGTGKLEELAAAVKHHEAQVVVFENDLSPSQIRNIEEKVKCKVIDRSELILDIFAARARTHEAKLQVELAQLEYTYPRLAGMWTHLERIGAGAGAGIGTRGPGEKQIEIDRRIVQRRKSELKREIVAVQSRKQREVAKRNADFFTVGLVGYTNAGKSTLFNTLTGSDAFAADLLFATLDTRTRRWDLGSGDSAMISDTVGFVRDLPHHLVASFRATLEESVHSDLLLILLDISDPHAAAHLDTVHQVLASIGADQQEQLLLLNKIDRLDDNSELLVWQKTHPNSLPISAARGLGLAELVEFVRSRQRGRMLDMTVRLAMSDGKSLNYLERRAQVIDRRYDTDHVTLKIRIGQRQYDQVRAMGARLQVLESQAGPSREV
jgi:GTP-binding protein HflX